MKKLALAAAFVLAATAAQAETPYQKPPKAILDVLHAPVPPVPFLDPTHDHMLLLAPVPYPAIAEVAAPMLRLGGVRVVPTNHALHAAPYGSGYRLVRCADGAERAIALPPNAKVGAPRWSADGKRFAFTNRTAKAVELWVGETATARVKRVGRVALNPLLEDAFAWMPDQRTLLVKLVPAGLGAPPAQAAPRGPNVQVADGRKGASSTYEVRDVLKSPHDEDLFDYYGSSQLAFVDAASGRVRPFGKRGLYTDLDASPDGQHLLVRRLHRPYSYVTTYEHFPSEVEVWNTRGQAIRRIASLPLADAVPIWGVPTGPRDFAWRPTEPATLVWAEALDGGDWNAKVPRRDKVVLARAPFASPVEIARTEQRFAGLDWLEQDGAALLAEQDAIHHRARTFVAHPDRPGEAPRLLWDLSSDERYQHPGYPVHRRLANGFSVIQETGTTIHLAGPGGSPEGDRPFLDRFDLASGKATRLFRSDKDAYESFLGWLDHPGGRFLTSRETPTEPPNYFRRGLDGRREAITHMADATPVVRQIQKRLVRYKRADGVDLSFTLYLPPGYKAGTRLPTIVWAYPLDYADAKVAGQVVGSPQRFTVLGWPLQLFYVLAGYAVIDNPSMPVVGDANKIYDTYMDQLVAGATAAVNKAVELGVTDRNRIGVTGHSHGGLMTANLLAHTDLFRAGVARSGAYNRSLTAFGFQNERRTLWQAPEVYQKVSPFFAADRIKRPLMLIHGEADANPGTVPLQSELLFEAIRGNGGTARLVMLPSESHHYASLESVEDVLAESLAWFDQYVKNAP